MEILKMTALLKNKKKQGGKANLEPVLGKATIDIMEKVDLIDKGKYEEWIGGIKEAVSVIHKLDKTDEDILNASTKLQEILTSEQSLTFLRMLDSGLFTTVAEKIKKAKESKFDEVEEKPKESKPLYSVDELLKGFGKRELVPAEIKLVKNDLFTKFA